MIFCVFNEFFSCWTIHKRHRHFYLIFLTPLCPCRHFLLLFVGKFQGILIPPLQIADFFYGRPLSVANIIMSILL
jgi:hypothetical protein